MDLDVVDLDAALRAHGHRVTRPRRVVWEVLTSADGHLSANEIADAVHELDPGINISSVYRTLALLTELGVVRESRLVDEGSTWEPAHADGVIHLVCTSCGRVEHHRTTVADTLRRRLEATAAFRPDSIDISVTGRCASCDR